MHILVNRVYNTKKQANNPLLPTKSIHILINTFTYIHYYFLNTTTLAKSLGRYVSDYFTDSLNS